MEVRSATRPMTTPPMASPIRPEKLIRETAPRAQPNSSFNEAKNTEIPFTITPMAIASMIAEANTITHL